MDMDFGGGNTVASRRRITVESLLAVPADGRATVLEGICREVDAILTPEGKPNYLVLVCFIDYAMQLVALRRDLTEKDRTESSELFARVVLEPVIKAAPTCPLLRDYLLLKVAQHCLRRAESYYERASRKLSVLVPGA